MDDRPNISSINPRLASLTCPPEIAEMKCWLMWRFESKPGKEKPAKVPYYTDKTRRHGKQGSPEDRDKLVTFEVAKAAAIRHGYDGVGFAILPGSPVVALDFDDVVNDRKIMDRLRCHLKDTYAEFSPSGDGVRAFVLQGDEYLREPIFGNLKSLKSSGEDFSYEVFAHSGFVTFTGDLLEGHAASQDITPMTRDNFLWITYEGRLAARGAALDRGADGTGASPVRSNVAPRGYSIDELRELLNNLDPSCGYDDWIEVGMCLNHETEGSEEGLALWDEWSSTADNYTNAGDCEGHWYSFRRTENAKTVATLLKRVSQKGGKIISPAATADDFDVMPPEDDAREAEAEADARAGRAARFIPIHGGEYANRPDANHVIEDVVVEGDLVSLFGPSGGGKSFVAIDIGMAIARGIDWNGKETRQGQVVYICCEGEGSFNKRLRAYAKAHDVDLEAIPFYVIPDSPNLLEVKDVEALLEGIKRAEGAYVVIIDTMAKATVGGDENSGKDMGLALRNAEIIGQQLKATIILVHHVGKDVSKGARGHSSFKATMGTQIEIEYDKAKNERFIHLEKAKDGEDGMRWSFKLQVVELDKKMKRSGEMKSITSCAIVVDPEPVKRQAARRPASTNFPKMGKWEALIDEMLEEMGPGGKKVKFSMLKDATLKVGIDRFNVKHRSAEKGFTEGLKELQSKVLLKLYGENVRLVPPDMGSEEDPGP